MRYVLLAYIGLFGLACMLMIVTEVFFTRAEERDPLGETLVDIVWGGILMTGMLFLALGISTPKLRVLWFFGAPSIVVIQLFLSWRARIRAKQMLVNTEASSSFVFPDIGTLLLSLPALAFNLYFALGGHV